MHWESGKLQRDVYVKGIFVLFWRNFKCCGSPGGFALPKRTIAARGIARNRHKLVAARNQTGAHSPLHCNCFAGLPIVGPKGYQ